MPADTPLLLDLTRLTRRVGRGPLTGIDRVELAWARHLLTLPFPAYGLVRTSLGFLLLDQSGIAALIDWTDGTPVPPAKGFLNRLRRLRRSANPREAEAALSGLAIDRASRLGLERMLRRHLNGPLRYLNTGHSNLHRRVLRAIRSQPGAKIAVLIHDVIPILLPDSQRPGMVRKFKEKLAVVSEFADAVFYVSAASQNAAEAVLAGFGRGPPGSVALISIDPPRPDAGQLPPDLPPETPYFVALGTIEPRKDHALLLDVWEDLAKSDPPPTLLILGRRGWQNHAVFDRLDALKQQPGSGVREISGLSDGAVAALLEGARALLMPSRAEGFGLPLIEAMALGTPVVACDLEAYRETVGDYAVYLPVGTSYSWAAQVKAMLADPEIGRKSARAPLGWEQHFKSILTRDW